MTSSSATFTEIAAVPAVAPFWYDLWEASGWSDRVARVWAKETAYRVIDRGFLATVTPTLAPEQKAFVERVLSSEGHA